MNQLSNVEMVLLQIVAESNQISGYEINKRIEQRGYREWAKIGSTSIYIGLQKLKDKQLIQADGSSEKIGKGPLPVKFTITKLGQERMSQEIIACLASTRERDIRFDLGLSGLPFIPAKAAVEALQNRHLFLQETSKQIAQKYEAQGKEKLPLHVQSLFLHPMFLIEQELKFIEHIISQLGGTVK